MTLLASERSRIPLCGNRVWVAADNTLVAERDTTTHTLEALVALGERADIAHVRHGGRRVEVFGFDSGGRAFAFQQGQWVATTDTLIAPDGGTFLSLFQTSHHLDSAVEHTTIGDGVFHIKIRDLANQTETPLITLTEPLSGWSGSDCVRLSPPDPETGARTCEAFTPTGSSQHAVLRLAYSPVGDDVAAAITRRLTQFTGLGGSQTCPGFESDPEPPLCRTASYREDPDRTVVHLIRIQGGQEIAQWPLPGKDVFWMGVSEDGAQLALGEGTRHDTWTVVWVQFNRQAVLDPSVYENCGVGYRAYRTGIELRPLLAFSGTACSDLGRGTISPAPKRISLGP